MSKLLKMDSLRDTVAVFRSIENVKRAIRAFDKSQVVLVFRRGDDTLGDDAFVVGIILSMFEQVRW